MPETKKSSNRTLVTFLLDRTGSMEPIQDDTIGSFNAYLTGLKSEGAAIEFSLVQFDSQSLDKICVTIPVHQVARLTVRTPLPVGAVEVPDRAAGKGLGRRPDAGAIDRARGKQGLEAVERRPAECLHPRA